MISDVTSVPSSMMATMSSHTPTQSRLVNSAHEFEAQLMKELVKPLFDAKSMSIEGDSNDSDDGGDAGVLGQYATECLARELSNHGGLGIADKIVRSLSKTGNTRDTLSVTGKLPFNLTTTDEK